MQTPANFYDRAAALVDRGFSTIPLLPREKKPIPGLGASSRSSSIEQIKAWAAAYPEANAAIVADENVTILESDDVDRLRKLLGDALPVTLTGGASENRPHFFFKRTEACGDECTQVPGLFEFRNRNQYVVAPGSIHPNGSEYRFWNDAPIVEMPEALIVKLQELADQYAGNGDGEGQHIQPGPYVKLRVAYLQPGPSRNVGPGRPGRRR
jgi:hypothetical protein